MTNEEREKINAALRSLIDIIEFELENDPEPEDLPSWKEALSRGNEAIKALNEMEAEGGTGGQPSDG